MSEHGWKCVGDNIGYTLVHPSGTVSVHDDSLVFRNKVGNGTDVMGGADLHPLLSSACSGLRTLCQQSELITSLRSQLAAAKGEGVVYGDERPTEPGWYPCRQNDNGYIHLVFERDGILVVGDVIRGYERVDRLPVEWGPRINLTPHQAAEPAMEGEQAKLTSRHAEFADRLHELDLALPSWQDRPTVSELFRLAGEMLAELKAQPHAAPRIEMESMSRATAEGFYAFSADESNQDTDFAWLDYGQYNSNFKYRSRDPLQLELIYPTTPATPASEPAAKAEGEASNPPASRLEEGQVYALAAFANGLIERDHTDRQLLVCDEKERYAIGKLIEYLPQIERILTALQPVSGDATAQSAKGGA